MDRKNFEKRNNEEYQKTIDDLFASGAARLIARGEPVDMSETVEHALFESRKPFSFAQEIPLQQLPSATPLTERIERASLVFTERRIDGGAGPDDEPLPDSVTLMITSVDINGNRCESSLELSRGVGAEHAVGVYNRMVAGEGLDSFEDHTFDEDYYRDRLTDDDVALLRRAIDSLTPVPEMEAMAKERMQ